MLCSKYGVENNNLPTELPTRYGSYVWRAVGRVWHKVLQGICWQVGDGSKARFWKDCWVMQNVTLKDYAVMPVPSNILEKSIRDYVNDHGQWNWDAFSNYLPHSLVLAIAAIMPPCVEGGMDRIFWGFSTKGNFTVKSAYQNISRESPDILDKDGILFEAGKGHKV